MTPAISFLLANETVAQVFALHSHGQWCEPQDLLSESDQQANRDVLTSRTMNGPHGEIISKYRVSSRVGKLIDVFVITSVNGRSAATAICLPHER